MSSISNATPSKAIHELGPDFFDAVRAAEFPQGIARFLNKSEALALNLQLNSAADWERHFVRFEPLPQNLPEPLALRYHGHQFRHYNPDLGDGRGFLFAQFLQQTPAQPPGQLPRLMDLGTKGSGQTPWSRAGDGRLTLKGAMREALATELLQSLGVNTSKTFCFFETGEKLERGDEPSPTRSAVLTRLSNGHIRFGTFQRLAYLGQTENIKKLMSYCLRYYFSDENTLPPDSTPENTEAAEHFLKLVSDRSARLVAEWMIAGFVHGVLNTDNMNITGESFDYGPYRFLPTYDPSFTAAYFDQQGLYCFGRQPNAVFWNVQQLAASLMKAYPQLNPTPTFENFSEVFSASVAEIFLKRLNLQTTNSGAEGDPQLASQQTEALLSSFYQALEVTQAPYEQTCFDFWGGIELRRWRSSPQSAIYSQPAFEDFLAALQNFKIADPEKAKHSYWQRKTPCTLLIDQIETIWSEIDKKDDWSAFENKISDIRSWRGNF